MASESFDIESDEGSVETDDEEIDTITCEILSFDILTDERIEEPLVVENENLKEKVGNWLSISPRAKPINDFRPKVDLYENFLPAEWELPTLSEFDCWIDKLNQLTLSHISNNKQIEWPSILSENLAAARKDSNKYQQEWTEEDCLYLHPDPEDYQYIFEMEEA